MLGSPETGQVLPCLCLCRWRHGDVQLGSYWEWMIATGMAMGHWTEHFGVHCCADDLDNKNYLRNMQSVYRSSELVEVELHCTFKKA